MNRIVFLFSLFGLAVLCGGCGKKKANAPAMAGGPPVMQVVAVAARQQAVIDTASAVGTLLPNESVEVKSEIEGTVKEIHFKEGDRVEKGAVLVVLDDSELVASVGEAEANFKLSQANQQRAQELFREKLISQQEFDQASATFQLTQSTLALRRQQLQDTRITAPFEGVVGARSVSPGQVINKNTVLTWLTDLDPIKLEFNLPERFVGRIKTGQELNLTVAAYGDRNFRGEVYFISQQIDPATRTALIKATVPNPELVLKPGMFANLQLILEVRDDAVVIPEPALARVLDDGRAMVFVVDTNSMAQMKSIKLGVRLAGQVEVASGIHAGETVIVEGTQKIGPGAKVKLAPPEAAAPYTNSVAPKT